MQKMTIKLTNDNKFDNQWILGENTHIFSRYAIVDYIENFDKRAKFYIFKDGYLVLNHKEEETHVKKGLITNLYKEIHTSTETLENLGFIFKVRGDDFRQPYTSRDKELIFNNLIKIRNFKDDDLIFWLGLVDIKTTRQRPMYLTKVEFLHLVSQGADFIEKLHRAEVRASAEVRKCKSMDELKAFNPMKFISEFVGTL